MKLFSRDKWKPENIIFRIEDGEPIFYALVCIKWGPKGKRKYDEKDIRLVERLIGHIKRHNLTWWEIREEDFEIDKEKSAYWIYYYPLRWAKSVYPKDAPNQHSTDLGHILERFNWMVKE